MSTEIDRIAQGLEQAAEKRIPVPQTVTCVENPNDLLVATEKGRFHSLNEMANYQPFGTKPPFHLRVLSEVVAATSKFGRNDTASHIANLSNYLSSGAESLVFTRIEILRKQVAELLCEGDIQFLTFRHPPTREDYKLLLQELAGVDFLTPEGILPRVPNTFSLPKVEYMGVQLAKSGVITCYPGSFYNWAAVRKFDDWRLEKTNEIQFFDMYGKKMGEKLAVSPLDRLVYMDRHILDVLRKNSGEKSPSTTLGNIIDPVRGKLENQTAYNAFRETVMGYVFYLFVSGQIGFDPKLAKGKSSDGYVTFKKNFSGLQKPKRVGDTRKHITWFVQDLKKVQERYPWLDVVKAEDIEREWSGKSDEQLLDAAYFRDLHSAEIDRTERRKFDSIGYFSLTEFGKRNLETLGSRRSQMPTVPYTVARSYYLRKVI